MASLCKMIRRTSEQVEESSTLEDSFHAIPDCEMFLWSHFI